MNSSQPNKGASAAAAAAGGGGGGSAAGSGHLNSLLNNSLAIRQEIQRFESVHPSIYAIYDLIELIQDHQIAQQIRDHVVCIEDSFVNSQEWTISRAVPELRLGIVGSLSSGKSALVHRYLTGTYMQEESPEGGRFKKEVFIDNQSYLLLIRDEGGPPEMQFSAWVDAVIFVFSLENEASFNAVYNYYTKMSHFRNSAEIPLILVGTADAISDLTPRCIDDSKVRKLASDLKRCSYYETCATYGLNVGRVFHDACQKIVQQRLIGSTPSQTPTNSRPSTPQGTRLGVASFHHFATPNNNNNPNCINNNNCTSNNTNNNNILLSANGINVSPHHHLHNHNQQPQQAQSHYGMINHNASPGQTFTLPHRHHMHSQSSHQIPIRVHSMPVPNPHQNNHNSNSNMINNNNGMDLIQSEQLSFKRQQQQLPMNSCSNLMSAGQYHQLGDVGQMGPGLTVSKYSPTKLTISSSSANSTSTVQSLENLLPPPQPVALAKEANSLVAVQPLGPPPMLAKENNNSSKEKVAELPTPTSTPTTSRKSRRRSNLFIPSSKKGEDKFSNKNGEVGSGRAIPLKQGYLYKRSSKSLNKEWKKKYVTLCNDGRLTYHPSLHDYMDDVHGKEIQLQMVTVKVPGQRPRGSKSIITNSILNGRAATATNGITESIGGLSLMRGSVGNSGDKQKVQLIAYDTLREPTKSNSQTSGDEGVVLSTSNSQTYLNVTEPPKNVIDAQTPNVKKRHRRMKSSGVKNSEYDDSDGYEFYIVSLGNKQWHFEAANCDEREEWVLAIEQEIFKSLQGNESTKSKQQPNSTTDLELIQTVKSRVPGNGFCADCDASNPDWASLNLGILMCIECSGIHRNLGSHISKVRSVGLDEWTPGHLSVMQTVGNELANSVWEAIVPASGERPKPLPTSSREEKEAWIRSKYEGKQFVAPLQQPSGVGLQMIEAILNSDTRTIVHLLISASADDVNGTVSDADLRTPLMVACSVGNLPIAQLLLLHNANTQQLDHEGKCALSYAKEALAAAQASGKSAENIATLIDLLSESTSYL